MANKKLSELTTKTSIGSSDFFPIADAATGQLYKKSVADLAVAIGGGVSSVNTLTGVVVLNADNIAEAVSPTNKYFTDIRARGAISAGTGISYNSSTGVITNTGQPLSTNLTSLAGLTYASTSFVKMTASGTFALDTNVYALNSALASYLPLAGGTLTGALGGTSATFSSSVTSNGTFYANNAGGQIQISGGTTLSGIFQATGTNTLFIGDWNTATKGLTINVANGASTFNSSVTASSFIKSEGTSAQFLKADGSIDAVVYYPASNPTGYTTNTGTVTSVSLTPPVGLSVTGSPITASGTLALTLTSGYSIPTTSKQTQWDTAYTNRITSLTTSGSSGSATLASNVLNVPTYTLAGLGGQPLNTNLTSVAGLTYSSTAFVKMTASGTFALDAVVYYPNSNPNGYTTNLGTVTSVSALSIGTSGSDISSTVANGSTTPTITLNIPTASSSNRGALSASDWTTFNGKKDSLNSFSRKTASYTLMLGDKDKVIEMNVGSANTLTIPTNASVAFTIGTEITIMQYGAGQTTIAQPGGVTIRSKGGYLKIADQYTGVTLVKVGTDEWYLIGNLAG